MSLKICSKCNIEKTKDNFCKHKHSKDGLQSNCKQCAYAFSKKWKENNLEKSKESHKKSYKKNKVYKEKTSEYIKKEKIKLYQKEYIKNKNKDPLIKIHNSIAHSLWKSLKKHNIIKSNSTLFVLGLNSWDEFRNHIESQWVEGMNWDNYGNKKNCWSIDHIIPKSSATTESEIKKLNYYTNLRPMWHIENIKKSNKIYESI